MSTTEKRRSIVELGEEKKPYLVLKVTSRDLVILTCMTGNSSKGLGIYLQKNGEGDDSPLFIEQMNDAYAKKSKQTLFDVALLKQFCEAVDAQEAMTKEFVDSWIAKMESSANKKSIFIRKKAEDEARIEPLYFELDSDRANIRFFKWTLPLEEFFSGVDPEQVESYYEMFPEAEAEEAGEETAPSGVIITPPLPTPTVPESKAPDGEGSKKKSSGNAFNLTTEFAEKALAMGKKYINSSNKLKKSTAALLISFVENFLLPALVVSNLDEVDETKMKRAQALLELYKDDEDSEMNTIEDCLRHLKVDVETVTAEKVVITKSDNPAEAYAYNAVVALMNSVNFCFPPKNEEVTA